MSILNIPGDAEEVIRSRILDTINRAVQDFLQKDVPDLALKQEQDLTQKLQAAHVGGEFLGRKVVAETANTVTIFFRFTDVDVPYLQGLKFRLVRAAIEIDRWINLTHSNRPPVGVRDIATWAIEIAFTRDGYEISIGGGVDKIQKFKQYRVEVNWKSPAIYFRGYLAERDKGGFLFDVNCRLPFCIPLGPTGVGLKGIGLLYGEHFAPDLREVGSGETALQRMERATALEYVGWAQKADLEKWAPVDEGLRIYGISAELCDVITSGGIISVEKAGIAYIGYGPIIVLGGTVGILTIDEVGDVRGAIDFRSRSFALAGYTSFDVIPWLKNALRFDGSIELGASLTDQTQTFLAIGGVGLDGCGVNLLGLFELRGGFMIQPLSRASARARARLEGSAEFCGFGGGYSFWLEARGAIGWNPIQLGGLLDVGGGAWIKVVGIKLGLGIGATLELKLPKPKKLTLDVTFTLSLPWPLSDKHFPIRIFNFDEPEIGPALASLSIRPADPISYFHGPSGTSGLLSAKEPTVWPDVAFELPLQRNTRPHPIIVNSAGSDGVFNEGGITVTHDFSKLEIHSVDTATGKTQIVPGVAASWILSRQSSNASRTNRLALPCNDPLSWQTRFDYAQPDDISTIDTFVLQTFGDGPAETCTPTAATPARFRAEDVEITSAREFRVAGLGWHTGYGRALVGGTAYAVMTTYEVPPGGRAPRSICFYDIRLIGTTEPPNVRVRNGTVVSRTVIRDFGNGCFEWSFRISRRPAQYTKPLEFAEAELPLVVVAIGYTETITNEIKTGPQTVLRPGNYRLFVKGVSTAHGALKATDWTDVVRDFEVIRPPLRPYLRYATIGDERIFGLEHGGWNPNPRGSGFGHYHDHLGLVRSRVSYLSAIYSHLCVSTRDDLPLQSVAVVDCREGTLAGSKGSQDWQIATGQAPQLEQEFAFSVPADPGVNTLKIFFSEARDCMGVDRTKPLDEWAYRISAFRNPIEHLTPAQGRLSNAFGPFGTRRIAPPAAPPLPAGFDFALAPAAQLKPSWALPAFVRQLSDLSETQSGLGLLRLTHWCGVLDATDQVATESIFWRPQTSDLGILLDSGLMPVGLVVRTSEPCDWRRVKATLVVGDFSGDHKRLAIRLSPSVDGCACVLLAVAEDVPVRLPLGNMALLVEFHLLRAGLPRLTRVADPSQTFESFSLTFTQPFGAAW